MMFLQPEMVTATPEGPNPHSGTLELPWSHEKCWEQGQSMAEWSATWAHEGVRAQWDLK